jgi:hypothetical protein
MKAYAASECRAAYWWSFRKPKTLTPLKYTEIVDNHKQNPKALWAFGFCIASKKSIR